MMKYEEPIMDVMYINGTVVVQASQTTNGGVGGNEGEESPFGF